MSDAPLTTDDLMLALRRAVPNVIESPYVPEGSVYIINDLNRPAWRPDEWDTMTTEAKLRWAVHNGMTAVLRCGLLSTLPDELPDGPRRNPSITARE